MEDLVILEKLFFFSPSKEKEGINNFQKAVRSNGLSNLKMVNKTGGNFNFVYEFECFEGLVDLFLLFLKFRFL